MHPTRLALALCLLAGTAAAAADWPTLLGPTRDGASPEKGIVAPWPKEGLKKLWECKLGIGYAPPVVANGKLYHFDRFDDACRTTCRDAATGKELWKHEFPTAYEDRYGYEPGPRACPVIDGDRVYVYGPDGLLVCLKADDGKELWRLDTKAKYHFHQNFFGVGSVPVVDGDLLIVAVGGSEKGPRPVDFRQVKPNGTAFVGIDKKTGTVKYEAGDELASYASPTIAPIDGKKTALYFGRGGLTGFDPQTGKQLFREPWRAKIEESVNAANPVVVGDQILLTECYGPGAVLIEVKGGNVKEVWSDAAKERDEKTLQCHWNTPVHLNGFVYGSSGRHTEDAELRCVELKTGEVKWAKRKTTRCTFLAVDGHLVSLSEYGLLSLIKPSPEKYDEVSKYEVPELEYPCWAPPVLSNGIMYVRGKGKLLALELIPGKK
ncbi:FOG: WD40 repeat-like protein OS=Pirellula staleyi (strain ATCC 27377 / DSM 6068 / ICPB 4128) GN=Psta_2979 PE=4 SV=1: PQQ_2 [Gemmataceae bacterium]|nr:FOG: WD40 repeat-like protein OS=Pirellula staleyi (strain ATCC 27377 / DSM 6068 / ICPB 4128) GN=Psta_2979 PE=4 SV=1: PQQ_2 [Gemmataceae bacterium]VTT98579.1 FOG: WD40 repeat-like protein OS=Pirellula staleyi (strain ATCC 27377 / DSM 6068 / ICPB 4128) GN=Psta_2979 PE=4 SV=1: PQQ_2 [Gemmataceae bacterium]